MNASLIWDSLAICEYLAERAPSLWPADQRAARRGAVDQCRDACRIRLPLRQQMAMDIRASQPDQAITPAGRAPISRASWTIWETCRTSLRRLRSFPVWPFLDR
jgi:glutathione S-transferase